MNPRPLPVHFPPMSNPHNNDHHPPPVDSVYHAIIAYSNPKMVRLCLELLAARRKRILTERSNFLGDAPLQLLVEASELAGSGRREFKDIAHGR